MTQLFCEICDQDVGTPGMILARWNGIDVCLACLATKAEMEMAEDMAVHGAAHGAPRPAIDDAPLESGQVGSWYW